MNKSSKIPDQVETITIVKYKHPKTVTRPVDAYLGLLKNWDDQELSVIRRYKALLLDQEDKVIAKLSFPKEFQFLKKTIKSIMSDLFYVAKTNGASKIIIGQNSLKDKIIPSEEEQRLAIIIKNAGQEENIPVADQIIFTGSMYYSFKKNGL